MKKEKDYVLGTHPDELKRLGLQHTVWQPHVLKCWHEVGITRGSRVLDIGAGPGYATIDLANIVGETGQVIGVERSANYLNFLRKNTSEHPQVKAYEIDLMEDEIPEGDFDFSWCRWVNIFVSSPATLIRKNYEALRKGGIAIFHEYNDYETWKFSPENQYHNEFVQEVMKSWRETGGDPNVAIRMPQLLVQQGFELVAVRPLVFTVRPHDLMWNWPASFIRINLDRQLEIGRIEKSWADQVMQAFEARTKDPNSVLTTPMMMEIIARKR